MHIRWHPVNLLTHANAWLNDIGKQVRARASENSPWWSFIFVWPKRIEVWIEQFRQGDYLFSPMVQYNFFGEVVRIWDYPDRLICKLILNIIKPTFKHIISNRCYHLHGPNGVKIAIRHLTNALSYRSYQYVIRADIRGYYASISREILTQQLLQHFQDPRLHHYFTQIVNTAVDRNAEVFVPKGIPRRSSLSPFFGALYLSSLYQAFEQRKGIQYFRYMDDIVIIAQTKRQYQQAKRSLYQVLASLELTLSPSKTRMGPMTNGFHCLGVLFEVQPSNKIPGERTDPSAIVCSRPGSSPCAAR